MRVLVACEFSGIVREAFRARGHDAWSCDLLPTEIPGNHLQCDVLSVLDGISAYIEPPFDGPQCSSDDPICLKWDLMIAHPPCTYISYAATNYWDRPGRWIKRLEALDFFGRLWAAPIHKICIENPMGCASPTIAKFTQIIQPYYFGDSVKKRTCLWLKNLNPLIHIEHEELFNNKTHAPEPSSIGITKSGKKLNWCDSLAPSKDRAKIRSKTFPGIARAMAEQWG